MNINYIEPEQAREIIENWLLGNFVALEKYIVCYGTNQYVAIDNSTNDCWMEEFKTKEGCKMYLLYYEDSEEVRVWEEKRLRKIARTICTIYYLLIFSMVGLLIYLIKI